MTDTIFNGEALATIPDILSAWKSSADVLRITFEFPRSEKAEAMKLEGIRDGVIRLKWEAVENVENIEKHKSSVKY